MKENTTRTKRHENKLSQEELARRAGISRQHLGLIETGKSLPTIHIAMRIARELGCTVYDLFSEGNK